MHELSIAQSLLDIVIEEGRKHNLNQVQVIKIQVGTLAAIVPDSLTFCFELISENTIAAGARLEIETVPLVGRCRKCREVFEIEDNVFLCPQCGDTGMDLVSGRDLTLVTIEGEAGENHE